MRKLVIKNWIIIFVLLAVCCAAIMGLYYIAFNHEIKFDFKSKRTEINNKEYKMEIEIPVYTSNKMNKEVDILVDSKKKAFSQNANERMNLMKMSYSYTIYNDTIYSFHYKSLYYEDETVVNQEDNFKYYDSKKNVELKIDDLVERNDEYYSKLKYVVSKQKLDVEILDQYYDYIIFSEDKIYLIIPNEGRYINVPIEYVELKKFLNSDYFSIEGEYEAPPVEEVKEEPKKEETKKTETKKTETKTETKKETPKPKEELKSDNDGSQDKIVPVVRDAAYFEGKKLIAFTFDDGPAGANTTKLLDALKARNYRATFFMVGNRVKKQSALVLRMKNEGHSIGQHSYSHANLKKLSQSDPNKAKNEIYLANDAIKEIIGENPRYIRPPYGAYNSDVLSYADMVFVNWSIDPLDWKYRNADTVYKNIISKAYDGAIVLVHDIHPTSVDGAIRAMDYLAKQGYAIVSLDEMIQLRGVTPQTHHLYNSFKK
ncbi:MAG: polysaccharide deacetylase family protein [Bacilli bacterium]|nr:polysaccharide deacetylase family protein [Bacilli bacterium]